jgi:putative aldouronate transport system substrate-binding protein
MGKKTFTKLLAMLCALSMLLAACGGAVDQGATPDDGVHTITMAFLGREFPDQQLVWDAINELTMREINMRFDPIVMGFGEYVQRLNLMLAGGSKLDILPIHFGQVNSYLNQGQLVDMSELIRTYGQGIIDFMSEEVALSGNINGFIYGIPSNKESASNSGIVMRKDIIDALGIDVSNVHSYHCITAIFETVHAAYPHMIMIMGTDLVSAIQHQDSLFDNFGVLMNNGQSRVVENYFESEWYRSRVEIISDWYQRGFVLMDAATVTEHPDSFMRTGQLFSYYSPIKPGFEVQALSRTGFDVVTAYIGTDDGQPVNNLWTNSVNFINWGIASNTTDAEKAMQFLNFAYTSPEFNNLMNFGIYDTHYVRVEGSDIFVTFPEGTGVTTTRYHLNMGWHLPNQFLGHIWEGLPENRWQLYQEFNDSATRSLAFGFIYDSSSVATELVALSNVAAQYRAALETGTAGANWETVLGEFNQALYAAGLQTVMDEKQRQLDEWFRVNER